MAQTQEFIVSCGAGKVSAKLPADRLRLPAGPPASAQPLPDAAAAFRHAVANPVGMPPLEKLVNRSSRVTIGIQDGRAADYLPEDQDLRILGLPILLELLEHYGVRPENIQIKVANAFIGCGRERKWSTSSVPGCLILWAAAYHALTQPTRTSLSRSA